MADTDAPSALYLLIALVFVASALLGRQLPIGQMAKMLLAWVAIIGGAFALFTFRGDFATLGNRLKAEVLGEARMAEVPGGMLVLTRADDGHFYAKASVNEQSENFLIDTGATKTTLDSRLAVEAGLEIGDGTDMVQTATGTVAMRRAVARSFTVGSIARSDFKVAVSSQADLNVIGMNFLSTLRSWRVEGDRMILQP